MNKKTRKQQNQICADLLTSARHYLGELNVPYVLILQGQPIMFTNVDQNHAMRLVENQNILNNRIQDYNTETQLDALTAIPPEKKDEK